MGAGQLTPCIKAIQAYACEPTPVTSRLLMPLPAQPTRLPATETSYRQRMKTLIAQCRKMLTIPSHEVLDYRQFVGWLIVQKPHWSRPTWRQYKAAVVFSLEQELLLRRDAIAEEALERLRLEDVSGCLAKTRRTSGSKLKRFPLNDYKRITRQLREYPSPWSEDVQRWLAAAMLTGLRPREWGQTTYIDDEHEPRLLVQNAKNTNLRAHGPTRTILIKGLDQSERELIKEHIERAHQWSGAGQFTSFYQGCAATLSRLSRRLWPGRKQHVSLYSARHQFSADAKASGLTPEEIAALMGHAVDITATRHYGKKTAGTELVRVSPDPKEVARIRSVFQARFSPKQPKPSADIKMTPPVPRTYQPASAENKNPRS